jgi:hypothetical protein
VAHCEWENALSGYLKEQHIRPSGFLDFFAKTLHAILDGNRFKPAHGMEMHTLALICKERFFVWVG